MQANAFVPTAAPFAWRASGLEPLPWFPFTVAASRGHAAAAERVARRAERAYWHLRRLFGFTPRFRLLVLDAADWPRFDDPPAYGIAHFTTGGHLIVGATPAYAWHDVSRCFAAHLPAAVLRDLVRVHGRDRVHAAGPDLSGVADTLIAHEIAHVIAEQAGAVFPRRWLAEAFANYALIAVLAETDPAGMHRVGTLAEAARALDDTAVDPGALAAGGATADPFASVVAQLALSRGVYEAYADAQAAPLARWFALARAGTPAPDADHELGRMLARDVHPALGGLVTRFSTWQDRMARAA
ncbi:MAG: hypothetical protein IT517_08640 [Burkholderiales bacterium]|nr:hypothetical protein [Burkholderiales bacterium]